MHNDLGLVDLALELYDSQNRSGLVCPFCKGGDSGEGSLWMRRDGGYVYFKCYRASCNKGGKINVRNTTNRSRALELGGSRRELEYNPAGLTEQVREILQVKYKLTDEEITRSELGTTKLHTHSAPCRLYIPIFRRDRTLRGYTARDLTGTEGKKALSFKWRDEEPNLSWHNCRQSDRLIIVEDQLSAIRASSYINAVALLGTTLNKDKVDEILRAGFTRAYLALDKDATRQAVGIALEWRSRIVLRVTRLSKDLKNMEREELEAFIKELD